jgi:hypothetical protein
MKMVELLDHNEDLVAFNPLTIVKVKAGNKKEICFVSTVAGPKFTDWTILESYKDVLNKINEALK